MKGHIYIITEVFLPSLRQNFLQDLVKTFALQKQISASIKLSFSTNYRKAFFLFPPPLETNQNVEKANLRVSNTAFLTLKYHVRTE